MRKLLFVSCKIERHKEKNLLRLPRSCSRSHIYCGWIAFFLSTETDKYSAQSSDNNWKKKRNFNSISNVQNGSPPYWNWWSYASMRSHKHITFLFCFGMIDTTHLAYYKTFALKKIMSMSSWIFGKAWDHLSICFCMCWTIIT
jgi:hypothetical protein